MLTHEGKNAPAPWVPFTPPDATLERFPSLTWNWRTLARHHHRICQAPLKLLRRRAVQAKPPKILSVSLSIAQAVMLFAHSQQKPDVLPDENRTATLASNALYGHK